MPPPLLHIPNDGPIRPLRARSAATCDLAARRRRLLLTAPYVAATTDQRSTLRQRALELYAIEAVLVARGVLALADALFDEVPVFMPVDRWKAGRRARGLKDHP
jgi:hypothetical protein